jgi:transcription factor IIIB 90 kDa subunit
MLIDFADHFSINVFELGHTFLKLTEHLKIKVPVIDPSIYIPRFSQALNFGDKQNVVSSTAIRLVSRMKRDWIITGRRPAGICAASMKNFFSHFIRT